MSDPRTLFTRDDLTAGLRELIRALAETSEPVQVRIVGGAAISLAYNADRASTFDIDAALTPRDVVLDAATDIADRHGWVTDWINDAATLFLPPDTGRRRARWVPIAVSGQVEVFVASAETLLAMKLKSVGRRGAREVNDLRFLLALCSVTSLDGAVKHVKAFYPGATLDDRSRQFVQAALDSLPSDHPAPALPDLV